MDFCLIVIAVFCLFVLWCNLAPQGRRWWQNIKREAEESRLQSERKKRDAERLAAERKKIFRQDFLRNEKETLLSDENSQSTDSSRFADTENTSESNSNRREGHDNKVRDDEEIDLDEAYRILGCNPCDDLDSIHKAYRKKMKEWHPDRLHLEMPPAALKDFVDTHVSRINVAWTVVKKSRDQTF